MNSGESGAGAWVDGCSGWQRGHQWVLRPPSLLACTGVPQRGQGSPVRLNFYRDETASCSDRVIFGDFGIARDLPAFKTTPVEITPSRKGEFTWTCGMNMLRGKLVVE